MKTNIRSKFRLAIAAGGMLLLSACASKDTSADERVQRAEAAAERAEAAQAKAELAAQKAVAFSSHGGNDGANQPAPADESNSQTQGIVSDAAGSDPKPDNPIS